jgi:glucose-1-phosphate thymidylyltransferase
MARSIALRCIRPAVHRFDGRDAEVTMRVTGVILAAGHGSRMRPYTSVAKACLPVCNRSLLSYQLDLLAGLGIDDVVLVVGHLADQVEREARASCPDGLGLRFTVQPERKGIAHALWQVRGLVAERLVVLLGDTYLVPGDPRAGLAGLAERAAVLSVRREPSPARIRQECTVRFDTDGDLLQIQEKPDEPFNDLKPCGLYFFTSAIFDAIAATPPSALRGEVEITDALQRLVDSGYRVGRADAVRWDRNLNTPADLLACNLAELRRRHRPTVVHPAAVVDASAVLHNVVVGRQARIGADAHLSNVVLLPGGVAEPRQRLADALVAPGLVLPGAAQPTDASWTSPVR